ncbi:helix-turn-helix transcriptional regulator [Scandinavium goeteborgense]|uniref:helix-turn-helix transcriptional regulator n=1 Tax=Scandinavium goeteborgense TaxID=1851514 RepID=UPI00381B0690
MNIYILTQNLYLYVGIKNALKEHINAKIMHIKFDEVYYFLKQHYFLGDDVFILSSEFSTLDFSSLLLLSKSNAKTIISRNNFRFNYREIFNFSVIPQKFYLSDLLQAIHLTPVIHISTTLPKITEREKSILFYISSGIDIHVVSEILNISHKTTYQHLKNALKKVGIRKSRDIINLPRNFITYMCHRE